MSISINNNPCTSGGSLLKVAQARLFGGEKDYKSKFDPRQYLATYYSDNAYSENEIEFDLLHFQLESLQYIYQKISEDKENSTGVVNGVVKNGNCRIKGLKNCVTTSTANKLNNNNIRRSSGKRLWDVGSGPSFQLALGASAVFDEIILSDVSESSRRELAKFLEYDATSFDWTTVAKIVGDLEGRVEDETILERVREKVKEVIACNVLDSEAVSESCGQFDAISCMFCFECACDTHRQYETACRNVLKRLKRHGSLILGGTLNSTFYDAGGGQMFRMLPMTKQEVTQALEAHQIEIRQWFEFQTPFDENAHPPRASHNAVYYICYGVKRK